jgi:hypothetical protein
MSKSHLAARARRLLTVVVLVAAALPAVLSLGAETANATAGGPMILDGTDAGYHGTSSGGVPQGTWLYNAKAYDVLMDNASAGTPNTVAVIGAADSTATSNNCGAGAHWAAAYNSFTATYYDGATAINTFFTDLDAGNVHPRIIHIVDSICSSNALQGAEETVITNNRFVLADFVNGGGGLFAQYSTYGWLSALLPTATFSGTAGFTPHLTAAGQAMFPGLTDSDIAAMYHGKFGGTFAPLEVLADEAGQNIIIGGTSVTLPSNVALAASPTPQYIGSDSTVTATVLDGNLAPVAGQAVTFSITGGPNAGRTASGTTDANGKATWTYTSASTGTDDLKVETTISSSLKSATATLVWNTGPTPTLTCPTPDEGRVGIVYGLTCTATGGSGTSTWTISAGSVPNGLSLSGAGKISGVPTMPGTYTFTVKVTAAGASATRELTIVVKPSSAASRPIASTPSGNGYWVVTEDGGVFSFGDAQFHGSAKNTKPNSPIVAIVASPTGGGYWLVGKDGGVFAYGDARFHGAAANLALVGPVDGIVATPDGHGYWLVAEDGGVFAYGSAQFFGSAAGLPHADIVALTATPDGQGYWLTSSTGEVFAYGNAQHYGGANDRARPAPIVGIVATPNGAGYWLVGADGGVFAFGNAGFHGAATNLALAAPIVGLTATPDAGGYWLVGADGGVFAYGNAEYHGGLTDRRNPVGR